MSQSARLGSAITIGRMDMSKPQRVADLEAVATELAGEIGDIVHADACFRRERRQAGDSEAAVESMSSLIQRASGAMMDEIDRAISELQSMRDMVRSESARVEREVTKYASMNQQAMASTKIIAHGLAHWRSAVVPQLRHDPVQQETS
jgi:hypothetical protein